jgi:chorismate mutase/prephenate dehydratase
VEGCQRFLCQIPGGAIHIWPLFSRMRETMSPAPDELAALRREIDSIDEQLHDLLMRRGEVVSEIGRRKAVDGQVTFRPAREAQLLHRLLGRHRGDLTHASIVRLWREIIAASIRIQGQLTVGYCPIEGHGSALRLANGHFGFDTPTLRFGSASQVASAVHRGEVSVGLVPLPEAVVMRRMYMWWRACPGMTSRPPVQRSAPWCWPAGCPKNRAMTEAC